MKGDSLEGSVHTPMYNPNILPLKESMRVYRKKCVHNPYSEVGGMYAMFTIFLHYKP